jgi:hypothetical protein
MRRAHDLGGYGEQTRRSQRTQPAASPQERYAVAGCCSLPAIFSHTSSIDLYLGIRGELIDYVQHPKWTTAFKRSIDHLSLAFSGRMSRSTLGAHLQAQFGIKAIDQFLSYRPALALKQNRQARIAKAHPAPLPDLSNGFSRLRVPFCGFGNRSSIASRVSARRRVGG